MPGVFSSFSGNFSGMDQLTGTTLVGLSRIIEVDYVSNSSGQPVGNCLATAQLSLSLGTGSRIVEIDYVAFFA